MMKACDDWYPRKPDVNATLLYPKIKDLVAKRKAKVKDATKEEWIKARNAVKADYDPSNKGTDI